MHSNKKIFLIGVNYKSDKESIRFIKSLKKASTKINIDIAIVDNTERQDSSEYFNEVYSQHPDILCIKPKSNIGYFGGARLGLEMYMKNKMDYPDLIIVCNVDIYINQYDFFERLIQKDIGNDVGIIAPSIFSTRLKRDKNPKIINRPSYGKMYFYKLVFKIYVLQTLYLLVYLLKNNFSIFLKKMFFFKEIINRNLRNNELHLRENIYAPHGSFIIFTKHYFLKGGTLDFPCFLFNEEIFVAETSRSLKLKVVYENDIIIIDDEHASTGIIRSRKIAKYFSTSTTYVANKYFS